MKVQVNELWNGGQTYVLESIEDCNGDDTLISLYQLVVETGDVITMGAFVALEASLDEAFEDRWMAQPVGG